MIGNTIAGAAIGDVEAPLSTSGLTQQLRLGVSPALIILVTMTARRLDVLPAQPGYLGIGDGAIGDAEDILSGVQGTTSITLGDGEWCGRPDDQGFAHLEAVPRLLNPGEDDVRVPYGGGEATRAEIRSAGLELINVDRFWDEWSDSREPSGERITFRAVEEGGYGRDGIDLGEGRVASLVAGDDTAEVGLAAIVDRLETPAGTVTYPGTGGIGGDNNLAGVSWPLSWGRVKGAPVQFESFGDLVFHLGHRPIPGDVVLYEAGLPRILYDGNNYPDTEALYAATVDPGFYTLCRSAARGKLGASPAGVLTADIDNGFATTADILLDLHRGAAGLTSDRLNIGSYGEVSGAEVQLHLAQGEAQGLTVAQITSALLRPLGLFYGEDQLQRLTITPVAYPGEGAAVWSVPDPDDLAFEDETQLEDLPILWRQEVSWGRNFRPLSKDELADPRFSPFPPGRYDDQQVAERWAEDQDSTLRLRYPNAVQGPRVRGYFVNEADAQAAARRLRLLQRAPLVRRLIETDMRAALFPVGYGGLIGARPATLTRRRRRFGDRAVDLEAIMLKREDA